MCVCPGSWLLHSLSLVAVLGLLLGWLLLLQSTGCSSCGMWASLPRGIWGPPRQGIEPGSSALAGGFLTTEPPGRPCGRILKLFCLSALTTHQAASWKPVSGFPEEFPSGIELCVKSCYFSHFLVVVVQMLSRVRLFST